MSLYDYELIVGDQGNRLLAFGKYAGRAGLIDFLHGLGQRMLHAYIIFFLSYLRILESEILHMLEFFRVHCYKDLLVNCC